MRTIPNTMASCFLGANTPDGFLSLFDELHDPDGGWRLYIIKGGPGTGKSTLMKRVAEEADRRGLYAERVYCSSDPASLDGVMIPSLKVSVADGTAPHVLEPQFPGAVERTVDLGRYRDDDRLFADRTRVIALTRENAACHAAATRYLSAAAAGVREAAALTLRHTDLDRADAFTDRLALRLLGQTSGAGEYRRRFLAAVTPEGIVTHPGTLAAAETALCFTDPTGIAASRILRRFADAAVGRGYAVTLCPSFLSPAVGADAVLVHELSLALFAETAFTSFGVPARHIRCERFVEKAAFAAVHNRYTLALKAARRFVADAVAEVRQAKAVHDRLEELYRDAMDFDGVKREGDRVLREIFGDGSPAA